MAKPWDNGMKRLMTESPQDFLDWLLRGAYFTGKRSQEFESLTIDADAMQEVIIEGERVLFHLEFQSTPDPDMEQRLLEYSVLAYRHHECPVCSVVVYLKKGGKVAVPPLVRTLPTGEEVLRFHFRVILLWDIPYENMMAEGLLGILPLVPLAQGGAKREVIEEIIARLMPQGKPARKELLALTRLFASLAFESKEDQEWLGRKFDMLKDILRDTPAYKQILEEGLEEGLEKGLRKGLEQGRKEGIEKERQERLQSLRQMILGLVQARYPKLTKLAKGQTMIIEQPKTLEVLLVRVAQASTMEEVQNAFLTWEEQ